MNKRISKTVSTILFIGTAILVVGAIICIVSNLMLRDWLIISYGIRTQRLIFNVGRFILVSGLLVSAISVCLWWRDLYIEHQAKKLVQAEQSREARILQDHMEGRVDPTILRRQFMALAGNGPAYIKIADRAIDQMNRIDSIQSRQQLLIQSNDARYLADTESALIEVEQRIWRNLRHVYNLYIAVDDIETLDTAKVERYISDNEAKLSSAQELVVASADWINQYESDKNSDRSKVESWLATIRESLQEED